MVVAAAVPDEQARLWAVLESVPDPEIPAVSLVDLGIASGEIDVGDRDRMVLLIRVMLIGLVDAVSDEPTVHRTAIEGIKMLVEGKLIRT